MKFGHESLTQMLVKKIRDREAASVKIRGYNNHTRTQIVHPQKQKKIPIRQKANRDSNLISNS